MTLCDAGDVFTIPANLEKSFDQISNAVAHVAASGSFPIILGGDHSIGFPTVRGLASVTSKNIGIIHFDRHADIQETDLDERMHTTPYFHATNLPNVRPENLVQIGIGGWQVPRAAVPIMVQRRTNVFSIADVEDLGPEKVVEMVPTLYGVETRTCLPCLALLGIAWHCLALLGTVWHCLPCCYAC